MNKNNKEFDTLELKRQVQEKIYEIIQNLSPAEEIKYFQTVCNSDYYSQWLAKMEFSNSNNKNKVA